MIFSRALSSRSVAEQPFDFGADPEHDQDPRIFLPLRNTGNCKNFAGSTAFAKVCDLKSKSNQIKFNSSE